MTEPGLQIDPADLASMRNAARQDRPGSGTVPGRRRPRCAARTIASARPVGPGRSEAPRNWSPGRSGPTDPKCRSPAAPGRPGTSVGDLMFAAEYGARAPQTRARWPGHPWRGSGAGAGYFLWPTIAQSDDRIMDDWTQAFGAMLKRVW